MICVIHVLSIVLSPHLLENIQDGDVVEEAAFNLYFYASVAYKCLISCIDTLGSCNEQGPKQELVDARSDLQGSYVRKSIANMCLEFWG